MENSESKVVYECTQCGACCRQPGYVILEEGEADAIAAHLDLDVHAFLDRYTRLTRNRASLSLTERKDLSCIFLDDENHCQINAVKPRQCQEFPHIWNFDGFERICNARVRKVD